MPACHQLAQLQAVQEEIAPKVLHFAQTVTTVSRRLVCATGAGAPAAPLALSVAGMMPLLGAVPLSQWHGRVWPG